MTQFDDRRSKNPSPNKPDAIVDNTVDVRGETAQNGLSNFDKNAIETAGKGLKDATRTLLEVLKLENGESSLQDYFRRSGGNNLTTLAVGEEGQDHGGNTVTTCAVGEEGQDKGEPKYVTMAVGESGQDGGQFRTLRDPENGPDKGPGLIPGIAPDTGPDRGTAITLAIPENGADRGPGLIPGLGPNSGPDNGGVQTLAYPESGLDRGTPPDFGKLMKNMLNDSQIGPPVGAVGGSPFGGFSLTGIVSSAGQMAMSAYNSLKSTLSTWFGGSSNDPV